MRRSTHINFLRISHDLVMSFYSSDKRVLNGERPMIGERPMTLRELWKTKGKISNREMQIIKLYFNFLGVINKHMSLIYIKKMIVNSELLY